MSSRGVANEPVYPIVVTGGALPNAALARIKRLTGLPLAEVKSRVDSGVPIVACECTDDALEFIARIHDSLGEEDIEIQAFRRDRPEPYELFLNLL